MSLYLTILRKKGIIARYKLVVILRKKVRISEFISTLSRNCEFISRNYEKKIQNCEIKSCNNLFYFLISGGNELPYYYLMHGLNIILCIRLNPQPLTKRSCKTTLCMCESCQAIFRNNILYEEIARSRKGMSYARALRMSVSGCGPFVFNQHGFNIHISLVWTHVMENSI